MEVKEIIRQMIKEYYKQRMACQEFGDKESYIFYDGGYKALLELLERVEKNENM